LTRVSDIEAWHALALLLVNVTVFAAIVSAAAIDLEHMILPNELTLGGAAICLLSSPLRSVGLVGSATWLTQGDDDVQYATAADSVAGVPASMLGEGSGASRLLLSIGLTYSSSGQRADGTGGMPLDAGWRWETTVASSGGIATSWSAIIFFARVYAKVW